MAWVKVPTRSSANVNAAADINQEQLNANALKAGDPDTPPTFGLENLKDGSVPVKVKSLAYPALTAVGESGGNYTVNMANGDWQVLNITAAGTLVISTPRIGWFSLTLVHDSVSRVLTLPTCYFVGVTGTSAYAFTVAAGASFRTTLFFGYDGANYFFSDTPFHA